MKVMFSKEDFVKIINQLKVEDDVISDLYKNYNIDFISSDICSSQSIVVELLRYIFDDEDDWVSWFCWETDFGRDERINKYWESDDTEVIVDTPEKLYDLLISNIEEKENNGRTDS